MKLCLFLCAAGAALATQDVTPPVMSVTLPDVYNTTSGWSGPAAYSGKHRATNGYVRDGTSVVCEVGDHTDDIAACPEPTCEAYDHHDGDLGSCDRKYIMVNDDNTVLDETDQDYTFSAIHRTLRSEWLIEFNAEDQSGNKAQTMTFTMVFRDTLAPVLTTEFGVSDLSTAHYVTDDLYFHPGAASGNNQQLGWTESCSECAAYTTAAAATAATSCTAPCTHGLSTSHTSIDKYDGDVKANTLVTISKPDGSVHLASTALATVDAAALTIDTYVIGTWKVTYEASDNANLFGYNEMSNNGTQAVHLDVQDNVAPVITITAHDATAACGSGTCVVSQTSNTVTLQCNKTSAYAEPGATCFDQRESWDPVGETWSDKAADVSGADMAVAGRTLASTGTNAHEVKYDCSDGYNSATQAVRTVTVVDTIPPELTLLGDTAIQTSSGYHPHYIQNSAGNYSGHDNKTIFEDTAGSSGLDMAMLGGNDGAICTDTCSTTSNSQITAELFHGKTCGEDGGASMGAINNFPEYVAGDYSILYTCHDGTGTVSADQTTFTPADSMVTRTATKCRYIDNVDHTRPIIQVLGADVMTLEASHQGNYVDDGAVCSDQVDGVISQNVEVAGDVVNLSKVGTYEIVYNCKDSAGNSADEAVRTVHIAQTSCPTCDVTGCGLVSGVYDCTTAHEASFPYTDQGATCSDEIDGIIAYETTNPVDSETTGDYIVTYRARNSVGLWSDGTNCREGSKTYFRTVQVQDTLKPVIVIKYAGDEVARGDALDTAVHNTSIVNPAHTHVFMTAADASGNSAWLAGAVLSSVAGLALLAHSRRTERALSVPV